MKLQVKNGVDPHFQVKIQRKIKNILTNISQFRNRNEIFQITVSNNVGTGHNNLSIE